MDINPIALPGFWEVDLIAFWLPTLFLTAGTYVLAWKKTTPKVVRFNKIVIGLALGMKVIAYVAGSAALHLVALQVIAALMFGSAIGISWSRLKKRSKRA